MPPEPTPIPAKRPPRQVAVIDIGSTSIRIAIGEIDADSNVRTIETLAQAISLGKDTFSRGLIAKQTIEDCVRVLKSYRRILGEYQITRPDQIRVVGTSAVREATNRLAFVDRVYIATGLQIDTLDETEVNRITYLSIRPCLRESSAATLVVEAGGGNTELLVLKNGDVVLSQVYRLGSQRLRKTLEAYRAPARKLTRIMESQVTRTVEQIVATVANESETQLLALGGDVRFAAHVLLEDWDMKGLSRIPLSKLEELTHEVLSMSDETLVRRFGSHGISIQDAETVGPSLLCYSMLAKRLKLKEVLVSTVNLRDGLLMEMARSSAYTEEFNRQIIRSATDLGRKFRFDEAHAAQCATLCRTLFHQLKAEHHLDAAYEIVLTVAALLHEIGLYVSNRSHHKHAMYLIRNSELFGLGKKELLLAALVARYHRRASPQPTHEGYATLDREERVAVAKMAAILRVAIALDESRSQRILELRCSVEGGRLIIAIPFVEDLSLEQLAIKQNCGLFEETFGLPVMLRMIRK